MTTVPPDATTQSYEPSESFGVFGRARRLLDLLRFAGRVLLIGCGRGDFGVLLKKRAEEVHGIEWRPDVPDCIHGMLDSVLRIEPPFAALPFPEGYFDAIIFPNTRTYFPRLNESLTTLLPYLAPTGYVLIGAENRGYWRSEGAGATLEDMQNGLPDVGLGLYSYQGIPDAEHGAAGPDSSGMMEIEGRTFTVKSRDEREALLTVEYGCVAVRPSYNPVEHARALFDKGRPDRAVEVLIAIPEAYLKNPDICTTVSGETLLCLLSVDNKAGWKERLDRFAVAQPIFYRAASKAPHYHFAYQCQAEFWRRLGNVDMTRRLLRTALHGAPDDATQAQLDALGPPEPVVIEAVTAPEWVAPEDGFRVLYVTHPRPHYGLDVLYDGLCAVLGDDNVVEFPYKPLLHGQTPQWLSQYPCACHRTGERLDLDEIVRRLKTGWFNAVLWGDFEFATETVAEKRLLWAARDVPIFLVDGLDECADFGPMMRDRLGVTNVAGMFKREMLAGVDYGPNVFPVPFAYPDWRVKEFVEGPRPHVLFWAGHRDFGLRRLYVERVEEMLGLKLDRGYEPDEYARRLQESLIGLDVYGYGFDTVRYWEIPAHGGMLLAERMPIRIPYDFTDGETAVLFDDLPDLEAKLSYYVEHQDEASRIARAGHAHLTRYHTGSARARQLLGYLQSAVSGRVDSA